MKELASFKLKLNTNKMLLIKILLKLTFEKNNYKRSMMNLEEILRIFKENCKMKEMIEEGIIKKLKFYKMTLKKELINLINK